MIGKLEQVLKELTKMKGAMAYKAKAETTYAPFKDKMFTQVNELDLFVQEMQMHLMEVEEVEKDCPEDEYMKKLDALSATYVTNANHHLNGALGAKTEYGGMLAKVEKKNK